MKGVRGISFITTMSLTSHTSLLILLLPISILHGFAAPVRAQNGIALIIIDVQNCFVPPSGTLPVTKGDEVIPVINRIRLDYADSYQLVVVTQDWHCPNHVSFASQHSGHDPFSKINLTYITKTGELCKESADGGSLIPDSYAINCTGKDSEPKTIVTQTLWPDHCIMNTTDAQVQESLVTKQTDVIVYKGFRCQVDSYSAFYDNGGMTSTELSSILKGQGIHTVHLTGLATDYCVYYSAKDSHRLGYKTSVIVDATRGIAIDTTNAALSDMKALGIQLVNSTDLEEVFRSSAAHFTSQFSLVVTISIAIATLIR